ncbi:MAG: hypothetical protein ACK5Y7_05420, partial [Betaproteobacteria bacterium]
WGAAWTTRHHPFHADRGQRSKLMADSWPTIRSVTLDTCNGCPRSPGTLSAISLEWVSTISGMRSWLLSNRFFARKQGRPSSG